ncbi:succinate dehydrogenase [Brevibacillus choshinensis]|uniref:Succinate dehydrogenase n=1 Tax=Brevibacillus choshinensis TaxID=54911 RepID=A0ABX7FUK4_BRECH|nr:succinate dehydrogenase [Brevibacillus choshinensis]QRG69036.1 succinate dehydrogenase [Brevibacillus choshinensis]
MNHFLLSRLHSLAGIVPLGAFLIEHFYSNAVALLGASAYDRQVATLQGIPWLWVIEILFILIPVLYHAGYGIYLAILSEANTGSYGYASNWRFVLQRVSGIVTLLFVVYHVWSFRLKSAIFGMDIHFDAVSAHLMNPWIFAGYVVGILSTTFHFTNGLWSGLITWGITSGPRGQRLSGRIMLVLFFLLSAVGVASLAAFV